MEGLRRAVSPGEAVSPQRRRKAGRSRARHRPPQIRLRPERLLRGPATPAPSPPYWGATRSPRTTHARDTYLRESKSHRPFEFGVERIETSPYAKLTPKPPL